MTDERDMDPEDLSARARRGEISRAEERELARALAANPTLKAAHVVGSDLDRSTAVRAGDDELVRRAADAALARVAASSLVPPRPLRAGGKRRSRARLAALLAALTTILASGFAFAVWKGLLPELRLRAPVSEPGGSGAPGAGKAAPKAAEETEAPAPAAPAAAGAVVPVEAEENEPSTLQRAHVASPAVAVGATAAELFRSANAARRSSDLGRARQLYSELIARHPSSDEASLARVSLGKLLLSSGEATEAEREFERYLADRKGPLAEEALVSRAESLEKLGRKDDERRTLERLLRDHPGSVYATRAKARLYVLSHAGDSPLN